MVPTISGTVQVGAVVTAEPGVWFAGATALAPSDLSYQWLRNGTAIDAATNATYTPVAADKGKRLSVRVTGEYPGYATASKTSATTVVAAAPVGTLATAGTDDLRHRKGGQHADRPARRVDGGRGHVDVGQLHVPVVPERNQDRRCDGVDLSDRLDGQGQEHHGHRDRQLPRLCDRVEHLGGHRARHELTHPQADERKKLMTQTSDSIFNRPVSRRSVIMGAAAIAGGVGMSGLLPARLAAAAAIPAPPGGLDLSKIKHVVYVMQENRSFDHYFGTFPGVRGFDDPLAMTLANGNSVFQQPDPANPDGYLEPYHMDTATTGAAAIPSLSHDWRDQHAAFNNGAMDGWLLTHNASDGDIKGAYTMGYLEQQDIPFHWALADNFTLCDNYHCSVMGPTYPNRAVWMSGTNDPTGTQGGPILETVKPNVLQWESAAEVLYDAGYTVKTYTSSGSYNYFLWWKSFATTGQVDTALYNRIMQNGTLFGDGKGGIGDPLNPTAASTAYLGFEEDCANGTLADVTWLFPDGPYASDEHPPNTPAAGAYFLASKLEALASNEDLWNSTVFIINYDENDGFFDHVPPPIPDPALYPDEYVKVPSPRGTPGGGLPSGSGFRVPCFIISPWTVGGHIYSQVADHTSPLQLIEAVTAAGGLNATPSTQASGRTQCGHLRRDLAVAPGDLRRLRRGLPAGRAAGADGHRVRPGHAAGELPCAAHRICAAHATPSGRRSVPAAPGSGHLATSARRCRRPRPR